MNVETVRAQAAIDWYHSGIDLGHGLVTRGRVDHRVWPLPFLPLPDDLSGKTVLDVGAWDGFMAFECERRGADVTALDSWAWDKNKAQRTKHATGRDGFDLVHRLRASNVRPIFCDVLDIGARRVGGLFDIVLFFGIFYHMRHPLLALERVASVTREVLLVESYFDPRHAGEPWMLFIPGDELNDDASNWWAPNEKCLEMLLRDVGFDSVTAVATCGNRILIEARRA